MTTTPVFERSHHLVALVGEVERLAALLDGTDPDETPVEQLRGEACIATLRLDGSTITARPDAADVAELRAAVGPEGSDPGHARGTWLDALETYLDLEDAPDERLWALEYLGAERALTSDDLAERLAVDFVGATREAHRRLVAGLVAPEAAGVYRQSDLAVQDGSIGRVVYYPATPSQIERDLHLLGAWVASAAAREHGLVTSGVVLFELLRIHPFLSANGRLARTVARLLLRHRGLDPAGLAVAEVALAANPLVSYEQVAKSLRRRDLTIWLETWSEAVAAGLRRSATVLGRLTPDVPDRARRFLDSRPTGPFSIADYRADVGVSPDDGRADLQALLDAGVVDRVLGGRGLRFTAVDAARSQPADV